MNYPEDTDALIYKIETDLQILKTNLRLPTGETWRMGDKSGAWDKHTHTSMYKTKSPQGHIYSRGKQPLFIAALSGV